jgi:ATP-dependent helicase Lhr and Lhr-like helicase
MAEVSPDGTDGSPAAPTVGAAPDGADPLASLHPVLLHHTVNSLGWRDLRPLQRDAVRPLSAGDDALLLAPTAGGKTEAAAFPLLSRMAMDGWSGTSVVYLCPLKALLNNLLPRLERYADWLGRRVALWHGDVTAARRRSILAARPDILLTTPESLESMLVSAHVDHRSFLGDLRTVIVDEVHAFAGDDRGWHLLALLERLTHLVGCPLQRIGLSATVGNPERLLSWLQGSSIGEAPARMIAPELTRAKGVPADAVDIELDYVGSLENAATVIAGLHAGQKRLVFCESRQAVEELGQLLRERHVTTFLSHASLSTDERRRAEQAFAESRDCVIVSTSTLELGIDVGDLDRVIQIDAPTTVSSFLQRLGRTGRRPGTSRNCLFLATSGDALLTVAALLRLWADGWVEPVTAPPEPRHIVAQQIMALCLQEGRVGTRDWVEYWNRLEPFGRSAGVIVRHLIDEGFLDVDSGMMFIGPQAEKHFGRRHFMDMTAVFTGAPEFTVLYGRVEVGRIDPTVLVEEVRGERRILLGGQSWRVTYIDWRRRRCFVEPADGGGRARWLARGWGGLSFELARSVRDVLLGADPSVKLTRRAVDRLRQEREEQDSLVHPGGTVIRRDSHGQLRWWTFAGFRANATLASTLSEVTDPVQRFDDFHIRLQDTLTPAEWRAVVATAIERLCLPEPSPKALAGLKFNAALPERLATATLATRLADLDGAQAILSEPSQFTTRP